VSDAHACPQAHEPNPESSRPVARTGGGAAAGGAAVHVALGAGALRPFLAGASNRQILPIARDAVFRRLLAIADVIGAAIGLAALGALTARGVDVVSALNDPVDRGDREDDRSLRPRRSRPAQIDARRDPGAPDARRIVRPGMVGRDGCRRNAPRSPPAGVAMLWVFTAVALTLSRLAGRAVAQAFAPRERVLIIGSSSARVRLAESLASDPGAHLEVVGFLPLEEERRVRSDRGARSRRRREVAFEDLGDVVAELDVHRVFLIPTSADSDTMLDAIGQTTSLGVKVSIVPRLFEVVGSSVGFDTVGGVTVLGVRRPGLSRSSRPVKRAMDVLGAGIGRLMLAPFGVVIALAIKLDCPGPVFFARCGSAATPARSGWSSSGAWPRRPPLSEMVKTDYLYATNWSLWTDVKILLRTIAHVAAQRGL
jgi:hypothetical protein